VIVFAVDHISLFCKKYVLENYFSYYFIITMGCQCSGGDHKDMMLPNDFFDEKPP